MDLKGPGIKLKSENRKDRDWGIFVCYFVFSCLAAVPSRANRPPRDQTPSPGFSGELAGSPTDVIQALNQVLEDQIIHGTHVFDKEPTLTGATVVASTPCSSRGPGQAEFSIRFARMWLRLAIFARAKIWELLPFAMS